MANQDTQPTQSRTCDAGEVILVDVRDPDDTPSQVRL